jgi:hypothetical protein
MLIYKAQVLEGVRDIYLTFLKGKLRVEQEKLLDGKVSGYPQMKSPFVQSILHLESDQRETIESESLVDDLTSLTIATKSTSSRILLGYSNSQILVISGDTCSSESMPYTSSWAPAQARMQGSNFRCHA